MGMKRLAGICLSLILCVGMLAGCGTSVSSDDDLVYVDKKGKVTSIDVEDLDASYYDEDELNSFVKDEIDQYTAENGKGTVSLKDLKVEDGKAKLTMEYKTPEDYAAFNGIELYQGKIVKALAAGYDFKADFVSVEDGVEQKAATTKEIYATENLKVVIIKANTNVQVDGDICYVSKENVTLTGNNSVSIAEEGNHSFETDVYTYIIYK